MEELEEIECKLLKLSEFSVLGSEQDEKKDGRYHSSMFWSVPRYGKKRWVIGAYIDVEYNNYLFEGHTEEQVVEACIRYLNKPPSREKFKRRIKTPLYGNLDPEPAHFKFREKNGKPVIEVTLVTDKRKNKRLWGEGIKL